MDDLITIITKRDARHYRDVSGQGVLEMALRVEWRTDVHWSCASLRSGRRAIKGECDYEECEHHADGESDIGAEGLIFHYAVIEIDLKTNIKALSNSSRRLGFADLIKVIYPLAKEGLISKPAFVSPSKSFGAHLIYRLAEPFTDPLEYEARCQGLRNHSEKVINPLVASVGKVDMSVADWTRLWRCCKVILEDGTNTFDHDAVEFGGVLDLNSIEPVYPAVFEGNESTMEPVSCEVTSAYGLSVLQYEAALVAEHLEGGRSTRLYQAACRAGEIIAGGEATEDKAIDILLRLGAERAGIVADYSEEEAIRQIKRGVKVGKAKPRKAPVKGEGSTGKGSVEDEYSGEDPAVVDAFVREMDEKQHG